MRTALLTISLVALAALAIPTAGEAEIIYTHGATAPPQSGPWTYHATLWAMNDNGSDPHQLLSAAQVGSNLQAICCGSTLPNSSTMAFQGFDYQYAGSAAGGFGDYYQGMYSYSGGNSIRLSPAPQNGPGSNISDFGVLTADGRVIYERQACYNVNTQGITCGITMGAW